jgi:hypothetical protein
MNLYHYTIHNRLPHILQNGYIKGNYGYGIDNNKNFDVTNHYVSLTRNINFKGIGVKTDVCFVFDKDKLKNKYKVIPYNDSVNDTHIQYEQEEIVKTPKLYFEDGLKEIIIFDNRSDIIYNYQHWFTNLFDDIEFNSKESFIEAIYDKFKIKVRFIKGKSTEIHKRKYIKKFESMKKALLISAFPGCGKSHLFKNSKLKVMDSDSSKFDKEYFPNNYMKHIKENLYNADIICISSHQEVRQALVENGLDFVLVYPKKEIKEEYIQRYKDRGSDENFIKLLEKNWDMWIDQLDNQEGCDKIKLKEGEYLSDKIEINK